MRQILMECNRKAVQKAHPELQVTLLPSGSLRLSKAGISFVIRMVDAGSDRSRSWYRYTGTGHRGWNEPPPAMSLVDVARHVHNLMIIAYSQR